MRFDPKFAVEFADIADSELLSIVAGELDKGTVAMPWRVKLRSEAAGTTVTSSGKLW